MQQKCLVQNVKLPNGEEYIAMCLDLLATLCIYWGLFHYSPEVAIPKIGVGIHYNAIPNHSVYKKLFGWKIDDYPNAKKIGRQTLSLPLSPSLKQKDILRVIKSINKIISK